MKISVRSSLSRSVVFACLATAFASHALAGVNRWSRSGPEGGNVRSIVVDQSDDRVIYAVVNGIIYKSNDAGGHWRSSNEGITLPIVSMVISSSDPAVLYAAGFGEVLCLLPCLTNPVGQLFKSIDAGQHWTGIPAPDSNFLQQLAVSGNALLVVSEDGVDRSADDGRSWQQTYSTTSGDPSSLLTHPDGSLFLVHGTVYRSTDGGVHWNALPSSPTKISSAAIDTDGTIYVQPGSYTNERIIYRSSDNGATWSIAVRVNRPVRSLGAISGRLYISLGYDPETLSDLQDGKNDLLVYDGTGLVEQRGFAGAAIQEVVQTASKQLFAATRGAGILTSREANPEWTTTNRGLPGAAASSIAVSPVDRSVVYAVTEAGLVKSDDAGATWRRIGDAGWQDVSVSPVDRDVAYIATANGIQKTTDGGAAFTVVQRQIAATVTVAPSSPNIIYAALFDGMAKSSDAGLSWTSISAGITIFNRDVAWGFYIHQPIVVDPHDERIAYLVRDEALYKTTTGGAKWSALLTSPLSRDGFADFWGFSIALDPADSRTLYVLGNRKGPMVSHDGGATWAPASFRSTISQVVFDPAAPDTLYAINGLRNALVRSNDRGTTISPFDDGLEGVSVNQLAIDTSGNFLYASTSQGIYSYQRVDVATPTPGACSTPPQSVSIIFSGPLSGCTQSNGKGCSAQEAILFTAVSPTYTFSTCDRFAWSFGDGTSMETLEPTISHQFAAGVPRTVTLTVTNNSGSTSASARDVPPPTATSCTPSATQACLDGGRYAVTLDALSRDMKRFATGQVTTQTDLVGYFSLPVFTSQPENPEVFVKVIGPIKGDPWVFYSGLTDVEYFINVLDTQTGQLRQYHVPPAPDPTLSKGDFDVAGNNSSACNAVTRTTTTGAPGSCTPDANTLCLFDRFRLTVVGRDDPARTGKSAIGVATPVSGKPFGFFSFPALTNDPTNLEVFVKMLDATSVDQHFWVFFGGLTDLEFTITVTDTTTGKTQTYLKPLKSSCGLNDTTGFP